jgi:hypothetical protein
MERSTFIVALVIAHHILSYTKPLSLALQNSKCDVYKAFVDAQNCKKIIAAQRSDTVFNICIWMKTTAIADSIGIEQSKPRTVGRMTNRVNAAFAEDSVPSYYRINAFFPLVDHCLSELNERFPEQTRPSFLAFQLLPSRIQNISAEHVEDIHTRYENDLPDSIRFIVEMERWKMFCAGLQKQDSNQSLEEAIELADPKYYPNLHAVFRVLLTMPVGSVPCERSFSAMRRLKHWSRSTMTEDRLAGLASLFIHRDIYLCRENIMRKFDEAK